MLLFLYSANGDVYNGKCFINGSFGGGLALTPDLYKQGYAAYKDSVCIPDFAFCNDLEFCNGSPGLAFTGDVMLENLTQLVYVGRAAFLYFPGTLTIRGLFPKWRDIETNAFAGAGTANSSIELNGAATALATVYNVSFAYFKGKVSINGAFPKWRLIGANAFYHADNVMNVVNIQCRNDTWLLGPNAFGFFKGNHTAHGEGCACSDPSCSPAPLPIPTPPPPNPCNNGGCIPKGMKRKVGQPDCCTEGHTTLKCPRPAHYQCGIR